MNLEETITLLKNLGIEAKIQPALFEAGIERGEYQRDPTAAIDRLADTGTIIHPTPPQFHGWESEEDRHATRTGLVLKAIETLSPGKTLVIPYQSQLFKKSRTEAVKKGCVLTTKPLAEIAPYQDWFHKDTLDEETLDKHPNLRVLPHAQLKKYNGQLRITDNIVGYKCQGTVWLINDILRAQIITENLDTGLVKIRDYSGDGLDRTTGKFTRSKDGLALEFTNLPSLSRPEATYQAFLIDNIPAYQGQRIPRQIMQAAFALSQNGHICEKTRWYREKRWRYSAFLETDRYGKPKGMKTVPYRSKDNVMCHHIILATMLAERYLKDEDEGWNTVYPFPRFNEDWKTYYMKLIKDVFIERSIYDKENNTPTILREPLNQNEIEILLWKRKAMLANQNQ